MTALTVKSDDLKSFLPTAAAFDDDRAKFMLGLVMDEAASVVTPVPSTAKGLILRATSRLYQNPVGVTQELVGPYQFAQPATNIFTKAERASLRRHAGGGGAFYIDPLDIDGTDESTDYPENRFPTS